MTIPAFTPEQIECFAAFDLLTRAGHAAEVVAVGICASDLPGATWEAHVGMHLPGGRMPTARICRGLDGRKAADVQAALEAAMPRWNALGLAERTALVEGSAMRRNVVKLLRVFTVARLEAEQKEVRA